MPRWLDGTATIVDGRVLITPPESDALYVLNLIDGKPLWGPLPRQDEPLPGLRPRGQDRAGGPARSSAPSTWPTASRPGSACRCPPAATPAAAASTTGNRYYVPLSSAEVAAVDLDAGKIVQTSKSREGEIPGNLVCYKGKVISQGWDGLEVFFQADALREEIGRRLAAKPEDAEALKLQGEMLLDEGKLADAIGSFRRAYQLGGRRDGRGSCCATRSWTGLRTRLRRLSRQRPTEIERLLDDASQRAAYLRLMAGGLQKTGQWRAALDHYLRLIDLDRSDRGMENVDRSLIVRRDRWIRAGVAALRREAPAETAAEIDRVIQQRLKRGPGSQVGRRLADLPGLLRRPAGGRDGPPRIDPAADRRQGRLGGGDAAVARSAVARPRGGRPRRGPVGGTARTGGTPRRRGRLLSATPAAVCRLRLPRRQDRQSNWSTALPRDGPLGQLLKPAAAWPQGQVETATRASQSRMDSYGGYGRFVVQYQGDPGPFYAGLTLRFDQNRSALLVYDRFGRAALASCR